MGWMGAGHCATMCGPITLFALAGPARPSVPATFGVAPRRITTYAILGAMVALFSASATSFLRNGRTVANGVVAVAQSAAALSALYLMGFQQAYAPVENIGRRVWRGLEGVRGWLQRAVAWLVTSCAVACGACCPAA